jgi:hypothetical protein
MKHSMELVTQFHARHPRALTSNRRRS